MWVFRISGPFAKITPLTNYSKPSGTAGGEVNISKHLGLAIDSAILLFYVSTGILFECGDQSEDRIRGEFILVFGPNRKKNG